MKSSKSVEKEANMCFGGKLVRAPSLGALKPKLRSCPSSLSAKAQKELLKNIRATRDLVDAMLSELRKTWQRS
eukprot:3544496-Amphidinium_carterae.1